MQIVQEMLSVQSVQTSTDPSSVDEQSSLKMHPTPAAETECEELEAHPVMESPEFVSIGVQVHPGKKNARIQARPHMVSVGKLVCTRYIPLSAQVL